MIQVSRITSGLQDLKILDNISLKEIEPNIKSDIGLFVGDTGQCKNISQGSAG